MDEATQSAIVGFNICLSASHMKSFFKIGAKIKSDLPLSGEFVFALGIFGDKNPHNSQPSRWPNGLDELVHGIVRHFMPGWIMALITHTFASPVSTFPFCEFQNLFHRGFFGVIDGNGPNIFSQSQPVWMPIDDNDLA